MYRLRKITNREIKYIIIIRVSVIQFKKVEREIASSWKIEDLGIFRLFDKYVWPRMVSKARRVDALVRFG